LYFPGWAGGGASAKGVRTSEASPEFEIPQTAGPVTACIFGTESPSRIQNRPGVPMSEGMKEHFHPKKTFSLTSIKITAKPVIKQIHIALKGILHKRLK